MNLSILYRGPLKSCNYGCWYCPFAKIAPTPAEIGADQKAQDRFVGWAASQKAHRFSIFFTPWGESLIWPHTQHVLIKLGQLPQVETIAIQTNLSAGLDWLAKADPAKLQLWCTCHPKETDLNAFLLQIKTLIDHHIRFSVGVVGVKENFPAIKTLRQKLPPDVYLWVNAYKHEQTYYDPEEINFLTQIDPLFAYNRYHYWTHGQPCRCGSQVFSLYGDGTMQRCHFIPQPIGNIYQPGWEKALSASPCTKKTCHCHIGYVHLPALELERYFGRGILARIPDNPTHRVH